MACIPPGRCLTPNPACSLPIYRWRRCAAWSGAPPYLTVRGLPVEVLEHLVRIGGYSVCIGQNVQPASLSLQRVCDLFSRLCLLYCWKKKKKIERHISLLFYFESQPLYGAVFHTTLPNPEQYATSHSSSPIYVLHISRWVYTQSNTFRTCWTDVLEAGWTLLQICKSCSRHPSRSGWPSQRKWITSWSSPCLWEAEQLLIL